MLRNVIVHIANEQPFMADLVYDPSPTDVCLICRNMRTMNGKKPVYVDFADSTFILPISQVRFIEIPAKAYDEARTADETAAGVLPALRVAASPTRTNGLRPAPARGKRSKLPAPLAPSNARHAATDVEEHPPEAAPEPEAAADPVLLLGDAYHDTELDADLLRRIREA